MEARNSSVPLFHPHQTALLTLIYPQTVKPTTGDSDKLSLYLSCQILDTAFSPDIIPTSLMFGIREAKEQIGMREQRGGWIWQVWESDWSFGTGNEYYGKSLLS